MISPPSNMPLPDTRDLNGFEPYLLRRPKFGIRRFRVSRPERRPSVEPARPAGNERQALLPAGVAAVRCPRIVDRIAREPELDSSRGELRRTRRSPRLRPHPSGRLRRPPAARLRSSCSEAVRPSCGHAPTVRADPPGLEPGAGRSPPHTGRPASIPVRAVRRSWSSTASIPGSSRSPQSCSDWKAPGGRCARLGRRQQ
jgi:hypothetical protein